MKKPTRPQANGIRSCALPTRLSGDIESLWQRSHSSDLGAADILAVRMVNELRCDRGARRRTVDLTFRLVQYYENVGEQQRSIELTGHLLGVAHDRDDPILERRARSVLGFSYANVNQLQASCENLEQAYMLSLQLGKPLWKIATLSNVVALLNAMGLNKAAVDVTRAVRAEKATTLLPR